MIKKLNTYETGQVYWYGTCWHCRSCWRCEKHDGAYVPEDDMQGHAAHVRIACPDCRGLFNCFTRSWRDHP